MATTGISPTQLNGLTNGSSTVSSQSLANNFSTFLTLLTTQLKNQNPMDPLDTNQFTQQLVQFAQVEQSMKGNDLLGTIALLQNAALATGALSFVGQTVVIDGNVAKLTGGAATWSYNTPRPASATFNVQDATGKVVYTESRAITPGATDFVWNGKDASGNVMPDGSYTLSVTAKDASGQNVAIATEVTGTVDSVDLTQNPPVLTIGGATFTLDRIKRVIRANQPA